MQLSLDYSLLHDQTMESFLGLIQQLLLGLALRRTYYVNDSNLDANTAFYLNLVTDTYW